MKTVGIYSITNLKNNKVYIGSTTNFERRFYYHLNDLRNNRHFNIHLQRAYNKDGEENLIYNLIEKCGKDELIIKEEYYINSMKSCDENFGYNINSKADRPPSWLGKKHSEETKKKISNGNIGKIASDYSKQIASETHKGKKLSDEQLEFLRNHFNGKDNPMFGRSVYDVWLEKYGKEEADEKLKTWKENKKIGSLKGDMNPSKRPEVRKKISESCKDRKISEEEKIRLRNLNCGRKASDKTKLKMSEQKKGENNPACKISDEDAKLILGMLKNGKFPTEISKTFNVSRRTIYNIKDGKRKL